MRERKFMKISFLGYDDIVMKLNEPRSYYFPRLAIELYDIMPEGRISGEGDSMSVSILTSMGVAEFEYMKLGGRNVLKNPTLRLKKNCRVHRKRLLTTLCMDLISNPPVTRMVPLDRMQEVFKFYSIPFSKGSEP